VSIFWEILTFSRCSTIVGIAWGRSRRYSRYSLFIYIPGLSKKCSKYLIFVLSEMYIFVNFSEKKRRNQVKNFERKVMNELKELLLKDQPLLEFILINAPIGIIKSAAKELDIKIEARARKIRDPYMRKEEVVQWVRIVCLPMRTE